MEHSHNAGLNKLPRLRLALLLTAVGMAIELAGGLLSNSLALLSDAGHMFTHIFALGLSYFAIRLTSLPAGKKWTYGFYRAEILAAFINGVALIFISFYLAYQSIIRFIHPQKIDVNEMLLVAAVGLVINGISTYLLAGAASHDLNIKSAFLHEIGDMISSVAVIAAGIIIYYTGNYIVDPLLSLFICLLIIVWAVKLLIDSAVILLEFTPKHLDLDELAGVIKAEIAGVHEVHHMHAWTIASKMYALTAHIVLDDCRLSAANSTLDKINGLLKSRYNIEHTNIQFECVIKKAQE